MGEIKRATAIYTGGNQYCYYAELDDGNWIMGSEEWFIIVDTNPLSDEYKNDYVYESDYYEWQMEHLVKEIDSTEYQKYLNKILNIILQGKSIKEFDNFSIIELKSRIKGDI